MGYLGIATTFGSAVAVMASVPFRLEAALVVALVFGPPAIYGAGFARRRVKVEADRVIVINTLATFRLRLEDIECFGLGPRRSLPFVGFARLRNGTEIPLTGIQSLGHGPEPDRGASARIDYLNRLLTSSNSGKHVGQASGER